MGKSISDGEYTIEVTLSGGSGKASVSSPAKLTVEDGEMTAEIEWSSSSYDYMEAGGREYYPENQDGNSMFIIDVDALDKEIPVRAETVAMSKPHMIDYTLYFDSSTVRSEGHGNGSILGLLAVSAILIGVAVVSIIRKKKSHENK